MSQGLGSGDLSTVIKMASTDKNLDKTIIIDALEQAILHAAKRDIGVEADLEATYNEDIDQIELFQFRTVVDSDDVANESIEIGLDEASELDPESELGDSIGVKLETKQFGRIAAQSAKQIIIQKVRDAERTKIYDEYKDRVGEMISGYVRRFERRDMIVDLGETEAIIPYKEQMPGERFRVKDRVQGYLMGIRKVSRGPQIVLSRVHPGFLIKLFEQNVTEIYDGIVAIESASRDPGLRSKIAVHSKDPSVDPVGACVGMKGARVQAVVAELNGEKIDIVPWDSDPARLVCNALAPAVVKKVIVDDDNHSMEVVVADDQLSLAIGKRGQNVRLAAQLTGWRLDIKSDSKLEEQMAGIKAKIASLDGVGEMYAGILIHEGVKTVAELADLPARMVARWLNLDVEEAEKIVAVAAERAEELDAQEDAIVDVDYSLEDASAAPEEIDTLSLQSSVDDKERERRIEMFLQLSGVGEAAAHSLADAGYVTIGDLIADSADEVSQKSSLPLGVARTVQMAADRFMNE